MEWLKITNYVIAVLFSVCYLYQYIYILIGCFHKPKTFKEVKPGRRYAVLISARNEKLVIGNLLDSIAAQSYPADLIDTYVIADNCTDETAAVAAEHGAFVWERNDTSRIGKGYALDFLFDKLHDRVGKDYYDAFFVIDADNLLDRNFVLEMDKCLCAGHRIATCYRNSKNYGSNWISSGYALWFLREAKHLNNARFILGTSCAVSGTGFMVHKDIINQMGSWKYFLLTEDIEFSVDSILQGEKIAYCHGAMLYDEQPETFAQSWRQRLRWSRGFLQVVRRYGLKLVKGIFTMGSFSCLDMLFTIAPAFVISVGSVLANLTGLVIGAFRGPTYVLMALAEMGKLLLAVYLLLLAVGIISGVTEWKNIHCSVPRKIKSFFTFPLFMMTYLPISVTAAFTHVTWQPIEHTSARTLDDVVSDGETVKPEKGQIADAKTKGNT